MKLYHGSEGIIRRPSLENSHPRNDYGRGFYCTRFIDLAKEWAVGPDRDGFVNQYEIELSGMRVLDLHAGTLTILHWLTLLLEHRTFKNTSVLARDAADYLKHYYHIPLEDVDVIIGYRADDSYFAFAQDFLNGTISVRQLREAMHLGELGDQYVLKSRKAFSSLQYIGYEPAEHDIWYARARQRDETARDAYLHEMRFARRRDDLYITNLLNEEVRADDERLRSELS